MRVTTPDPPAWRTSTHPRNHARTRTQRAPPGPLACPAAAGHSQEVLHRDADDRAFHKMSGQRQRRRRTLFLARDLRRGIFRKRSLGGQGRGGRGLPARSRHPGVPSAPRRLPVPPTCTLGALTSRSRANCAARDPAREPAPRLRSPARRRPWARPAPPRPLGGLRWGSVGAGLGA